jgi:hypothetical protein
MGKKAELMCPYNSLDIFLLWNWRAQAAEKWRLELEVTLPYSFFVIRGGNV